MTEVELEALFYVLGWIIHAMAEASLLQSKNVNIALCKFFENVSLDPLNVTERSDLPTNQVDTKCHFGGLWYSSKHYFFFIQKIENVFRNMLSEKNLLIFGAYLSDKIYQALSFFLNYSCQY